MASLTHPQVSIIIYDDPPGVANFLSQYKNLFHHYTHQTAQTDASTFWGPVGQSVVTSFGLWGV